MSSFSQKLLVRLLLGVLLFFELSMQVLLVPLHLHSLGLVANFLLPRGSLGLGFHVLHYLGVFDHRVELVGLLLSHLSMTLLVDVGFFQLGFELSQLVTLKQTLGFKSLSSCWAQFGAFKLPCFTQLLSHFGVTQLLELVAFEFIGQPFFLLKRLLLGYSVRLGSTQRVLDLLFPSNGLLLPVGSFQSALLLALKHTVKHALTLLVPLELNLDLGASDRRRIFLLKSSGCGCGQLYSSKCDYGLSKAAQ